MKILFTGASSFTGFWFVRTLAAQGHAVVCPLTRDLAAYDGGRRQRLEGLAPLCRLVPAAPFGSETFLQLARTGHFDLLCHHAADVTNYKSASFDTAAAFRNNTLHLTDVLAALKNLTSVVLTGTYFEADEGRGDVPLKSFSPYSLSKTLTFGMFRTQCRQLGLKLGKFVIPNPFGPFEEPRFTAFLMNHWRAGRPVEVKTPDYVRDNIHVDLLAAVYAQFAQTLAASDDLFLKVNPSGYAEKQGDFSQRVAREVKARTGWACELNLARQQDFSEPLDRTNTDPAPPSVPGWSETHAWDAFVNFYAETSH